MRGAGIAGAIALAASSGCVEPTGFACDRDAQCVSADAGVCAAGACAYPDAACESDLRYGEAALDRAGLCVAPPDPTSSTGVMGETSSSSTSTGEAASSSSSTAEASTGSPDPICGNGIVEGDERCDGADDCNEDCTEFGQLLDQRIIEIDGEETHLRGVVDIADGEFAVAGTVGTGDGRRAFVRRLGPALEEGTSWQAAAESYGNDIIRVPLGALVMVSGGGTAALHGMGVELDDPTTVDLSASAAKAVSTVNSRALVVGQTSGGLFVESRDVTAGGWLDMKWRYEASLGGQEIVEGIIALDYREALLVGRRSEDFWVGHLQGDGGTFSLSTLLAIDGTGSRDTARAATMTSDDRVLVSGYLTTRTESWDATVVAMDLAGTEQWRWIAQEPLLTHDEAMAVTLDPAAPVAVIGGYVTKVDRDAFLAKLDVDDGSLVWMRTYPEVDGNHTIYGVVVRSDGRIVAVGDVSTDAGPRGWIGVFAP